MGVDTPVQPVRGIYTRGAPKNFNRKKQSVNVCKFTRPLMQPTPPGDPDHTPWGPTRARLWKKHWFLLSLFAYGGNSRALLQFNPRHSNDHYIKDRKKKLKSANTDQVIPQNARKISQRINYSQKKTKSGYDAISGGILNSKFQLINLLKLFLGLGEGALAKWPKRVCANSVFLE